MLREFAASKGGLGGSFGSGISSAFYRNDKRLPSCLIGSA